MSGDTHGFGSMPPRLMAVVLIISIAGAIGLIYLFSQNNMSLAALPPVVSDTPLEETTNVFGIRNAVVGKTTSPDDELELQANSRGDSIDFVAINRGSIPVLIDVDKWGINTNIYGIRDSRIIDEPLNVVVNSGDELVLQTLDLSEYLNLLEYYPGTHSFELSGFKWTTELVGPYHNVTTGTNIKVINIEAKVTIDYDQGILKSSVNKLLRADGMSMSIAGDGPAFEVSDDSPKDVSFYFTNEAGSDLNIRVVQTITTVWKAGERFPDDIVFKNIDGDSRHCTSLKPGDTLQIGALHLSKDQSPIGGNGIAKLRNSDAAVPGVYIANYVVDYIPCDASSEAALMPQSSIFAAFEVKS